MTVEAASFAPGGTETFADIEAAVSAPGKTWVRVTDADGAAAERVAAVFDLHPLAIEDATVDARPKLEQYDDYTLVVCSTARLASGEQTFEDELVTTPVGLFIGADWLVTVSPEPVDAVDRVWTDITSERDRALERSADFTAYRVLDRVVDGYFHLLDGIETTIETIEDDVIEASEPRTLERANAVRRDLLSVRKLLWPTREALSPLARGDPPQINESNEKYFRDVYDHCVQLVDLAETYRDLVRGARDIYLNSVSQSTNETMKQLTVVATIILPLTFVAGIYGMNFADSPFNMPELAWTYGYPAVMVGMLVIALTMLAYFRRQAYI
jgi:magnesium transporter